MEAMGATWNAIDATMPFEESEIMAQLFGTYSSTNECYQDSSLGMMPSIFGSGYHLGSYHSLDNVNANLSSHHWPQGHSSTSSSSSTSFLVNPSDYQRYYINDPNVVNVAATNDTNDQAMGFCIAEEEIIPSSFQNVLGHQFVDTLCINEETSDNNLGDISLKRKLHTDEISSGSPKKKTCATVQVAGDEKNIQLKKIKKRVKGGNEEINAGFHAQSSSSCSSEDDSNGSQELNGGSRVSSASKASTALNLNGKKRASRGSATDPQSLYARKRRERINERLRILQNLVPNGTKVDISTMLEEAVHYVKFLQHQIKLLSSDELWMYAPLAYNGMNIGLDLMISPSKQ